MQLKSRDEVQSEINAMSSLQGFASAGDVADKVMAACAPFAAHDSLEAVPFPMILQLVLQIIPIIFGEDGFSFEKMLAVLKLIEGIFQ
jgi:hypothetical protein